MIKQGCINTGRNEILMLTVFFIYLLGAANAATIYVNSSYTGNLSNGSYDYPYPTITLAIANSVDGDVIIVQPGFYNETVKITKSLTIIGNITGGSFPVVYGNYDNNDYITDANGTILYYGCVTRILPSDVVKYGIPYDGSVIFINSTKDVVISNLNITHSRKYRNDAGIKILNSVNVTVNNTIISNACDGVYSRNSSNVTINNVTAPDVGKWAFKGGYGRNGNSIAGEDIRFAKIYDTIGDIWLGYYAPVKNITIRGAFADGYYFNLFVSGEDIDVANSIFKGASNLDIFVKNSKNYLFRNVNFTARVDIDGVSNINLKRFVSSFNVSGYIIDLYNITGTIVGNQSCVRFYYPENVTTILQLLGISEMNITLYYYNETTKLFEPVNATLNASLNYVEACLTHFSTYALGYISSQSPPQPSKPKPISTPSPSDGGGGGGSVVYKPYLSLYPKHFKSYNTFIVYGDDAADEDILTAMDIANYLGFPKTRIKKASELTVIDREKNLILIGGAAVNQIVADLNDRGKLRYRYENRDGHKFWVYVFENRVYSDQQSYVIEVLRNPYTSYKSRFIIVVAGLTRDGTMKAGKLLVNTNLKPEKVWLQPKERLPDISVLTSWEERGSD